MPLPVVFFCPAPLSVEPKSITGSLVIRKSREISENSGKQKAQKHKQFYPVSARVGGGSPDQVARGQPFMCCVQSPRNINIFVRVSGWEAQ